MCSTSTPQTNFKMPTEKITTFCEKTGNDFTCTTNLSDFYNGSVNTFNTPFFSAGEMFISFLLLIGLIIAIIALIKSGVFSVAVNKKYETGK